MMSDVFFIVGMETIAIPKGSGASSVPALVNTWIHKRAESVEGFDAKSIVNIQVIPGFVLVYYRKNEDEDLSPEEAFSRLGGDSPFD